METPPASTPHEQHPAFLDALPSGQSQLPNVGHAVLRLTQGSMSEVHGLGIQRLTVCFDPT
jgi:hypothetical protein